MKDQIIKPCRLCGQLRPLRNSHIFPKFYWDWLKETGSAYFRTPERPTQRIQDGFKRYLLCADCEQLFSAFETPTAEHVFKPIVKNPATSVHYGKSFYRFLISVLWRNLAIDIDDDINQVITPEFHKVEEAWRLFLQDKQPLTSYCRIHVFITFIPVSGPRGHSLYLTRESDFSLVTSAAGPMAVYAKFARFMIWAEVAAINPDEWVNTLIVDGPGVLSSPKQKILDRGFGCFIIERSEKILEAKKDARSRLSPTQRDKILQWVAENEDRLIDSELMKAMLADTDPGILLPSSPIPKVGRNDPCPCGSRNKYKRCHGSGA